MKTFFLVIQACRNAEDRADQLRGDAPVSGIVLERDQERGDGLEGRAEDLPGQLLQQERDGMRVGQAPGEVQEGSMIEDSRLIDRFTEIT